LVNIAQMQKMDETRPEVQEFEHLKDFFDTIVKLASAKKNGFPPRTQTPRLVKTITNRMVRIPLSEEVASLDTGLRGLGGYAEKSIYDEEEPVYQPLPIEKDLQDEESRQIDEMMKLTNMSQGKL
jgi:hypothetical protein